MRTRSGYRSTARSMGRRPAISSDSILTLGRPSRPRTRTTTGISTPQSGQRRQLLGLLSPVWTIFEGATVGVLGNGANQPTRVVTAGQVTIQEPVTTVLVGLPYTSQVKPMNINIPSQDGTTQGRKVRIHEMVVRFYKSLTCQFSSDGNGWDEIFFRDRVDLMDTSPSVFTGDRKISTGASFDTQMAITLRQTRPFPCCVLAMILWANYYGD